MKLVKLFVIAVCGAMLMMPTESEAGGRRASRSCYTPSSCCNDNCCYQRGRRDRGPRVRTRRARSNVYSAPGPSNTRAAFVPGPSTTQVGFNPGTTVMPPVSVNPTPINIQPIPQDGGVISEGCCPPAVSSGCGCNPCQSYTPCNQGCNPCQSYTPCQSCGGGSCCN